MKWLSLALSLSFVAVCSAATGDTTVVRTHDKVLIQTDPSKGHTEYAAWGQFPKKGTSIRKMYARLTFQCPPGMTCGEWDYTNSVSIVRRHGGFNDTLNWEIFRLITPYGLQFSKTWNHTWQFDLTDLATLFADSIEIEYHHSGYEARNGRGWLITLDFTMIEGPPVQEVQSVKLLYHKNIGYGNDSLFDANIPEVTYKTHDQTERVRYKVIQTGHGSDATGCGEFCAKVRYMVHDKKAIDSTLVWRDDCGMNPVYPQGGTWVYDRANWCPGADVRVVDYDVPVTPGSTHSIDLDMESYKGGGNYDISLYLIEYKKSRFINEAGIEEIMAPSDEPRFSRQNPVCSNPVIMVQNNGRNAISRLRIDYGWQHRSMQTYYWTGNLQPLQSESIELPFLQSFDTFPAVFEARIISVNNLRDEYPLNDVMTSKPSGRAAVVPDKLIIYFKTNNAPSENYYSLIKSDGTVILDRKNFTLKNKIYRDTVQLTPGCYKLTLMDDGPPPTDLEQLNRDGLYWWANTADGTGAFMVRDGYTNAIIKNFQNDFGTGIWYEMQVGTPVHSPSATNHISVYPNPVQNELMVDLGTNTTGSLSISLTDITGRKILEQTRTGFLQAVQFLNVQQFPSGVYEITVILDGQKYSHKMIIE